VVKDEYRMTVWPGQRVPVGRVLVVPVTVENSGSSETLGDAVSWRDVPDELYLRELMDLDLSDARAISAFTATYGVLGRMDWSLVPDPSSKRGGATDPSLIKLQRRLKREAQAWPAGERKRRMSKDAIVYHARLLRDCVRLLDARQNGGEAKLESSLRLEPAELFVPVVLNAGLTAYHVYVDLPDADLHVPYGPPRPNLYSALCLQMANHIAEAAVYRRCANESCGRLFVRQRGRAAGSRERRTEGVRFCSAGCARTQAAREYRRRKGAKGAQ